MALPPIDHRFDATNRVSHTERLRSRGSAARWTRTVPGGAPYPISSASKGKGEQMHAAVGRILAETARLIASDGAAVDELGASVAISGAAIVAGAPFHMVGANKQQGAAYTFASTGGTGRIQTSRLIDPEGAA